MHSGSESAGLNRHEHTDMQGREQRVSYTVSKSGERHAKLSDDLRVRRLIQEVGQKRYDKRKSSAIPPYDMEDLAKRMLVDYAHEVATSVLEGACTLAKHRKSNKLALKDINMILSKLPTAILGFSV